MKILNISQYSEKLTANSISLDDLKDIDVDIDDMPEFTKENIEIFYRFFRHNVFSINIVYL